MNTEKNGNEYRLLAIVAHPDDETVAIGGTLARYSHQGAQTYVIIATDGDVGHAPEGLKGHSSVAEMRATELECAARSLGLGALCDLGQFGGGRLEVDDDVAAEDQVLVRW